MTNTIVVDELEQAVSALALATELMRRSGEEPMLWRWTVLVLHQAVQGFMVCALAGSDGTRALNHRRRDVKRYIAALRTYSQTGNYPTLPLRALDNFESLYRKVKDPSMMGHFTSSKAFVASKELDHGIREMNHLRNEFQHFTPKKWVIAIDALAAPILSALELMNFLAFQSNNVVWARHAQGSAWKAEVGDCLALANSIMSEFDGSPGQG